MIDNILYEIHKNGLIVIDTGDLLNTTLTVRVFSLAAGGTWTGFNSSAPCKLIIESLDPYPKLFIHPVVSNFAANLSVAVWCKRNDTPEDVYEYCVTFDTEMTFNSQVTVNEELKIILKIDTLKWVFNSVIDSARGNFSLWLLNLTLSAAMGTIAIIINTLLGGGLDINWLISEILGTDIFYFEAFTLSEQEELLFAKLTPALRIKELKIPSSTANFKVPGFGDMLTKIAQENEKRGGSIEEYVSEKIDRMFDDL